MSNSDDLKIYCGAGKIPNGARRGTMEECIRANQVRYYGIKAIDTKKMAEQKHYQSLQVKVATSDIKLKQLFQLHKHESDPKTKEQLRKKLISAGKKFEKLRDELNKLK